MDAQRWTRWVAVGLVLVVALVGALVGALGLTGGSPRPRAVPSPDVIQPESTLVLPRQPLGWNPVENAGTAEARRSASEFGEGFGARTLYAEYARDGSRLEFTGIMPAAGTDLREALVRSPGGAIAHQFVNVGLGEGTPYPSGAPGVSLRCGAPRPGVQACIWADESVLALMSWQLSGGLPRAAVLTRSLIPAFRRATD